MFAKERQAASFSRMFLYEAASEFLKAVRMPSFALPSIIFPIGFYVLFGLVIQQGANVATYLMATFGVLAAMGPALFGFGIGVASDRQLGWLDLKRLSPLPVAGFLLAKLFMCILFALVILAAIYSLGAFLGGAALTTGQWALLALAHLSAAPPMMLLGLNFGLRLPMQGAAGVVNIVFMLMSALGGLWMPIMYLPEPLQRFALILPTYHLAEISLGIVGAREQGGALVHIAVLIGFTLVFAIFAARAWSRAAAR